MNFRDKKYTEEEIREYIKKNHGYLYHPSWYYISKHQKLSEEFIREFKCKVWWSYILEFQNLSEEFLIDNIESFEIYWFKGNKKIPKDVKERIINLKKVIDQ